MQRLDSEPISSHQERSILAIVVLQHKRKLTAEMIHKTIATIPVQPDDHLGVGRRREGMFAARRSKTGSIEIHIKALEFCVTKHDGLCGLYFEDRKQAVL
jgi:hypothetical protein